MDGGFALKAHRLEGPSGRRYDLVASTPIGLVRLLHDAPSAQLLRLLAVLITAGAVCYPLARYVARPLGTLRAATHELAGGNLAVRVGPTVGRRRDELGDLARDFDRMAERIEALMTSERRLLRDISHELRSPLARLHVALGLARQPASDDQWALDRIEREAERLNALIGQLLMLARLESGAMEPTREPVDLAAVVRDHGSGVPDELLPHIFHPFYRVGDARDRHTGGVGLGLTIADRTIRLHGGTVRAANARDGGLIVEVTLPIEGHAVCPATLASNAKC